MKLSANEEYGLRCLVRMAYAGPDESLTIPEISQAEGALAGLRRQAAAPAAQGRIRQAPAARRAAIRWRVRPTRS